ncbi:MAG: CHASE domain-containing protein [Thermoanaerobaculia bacterium]
MGETQRKPESPALGSIAKIAGIAAVYFAVGRLTLFLEIPPGYAMALWPPAGIALAGILLFGFRLWSGVFIGALLVVVSTSFDSTSLGTTLLSIALSASVAGGAALQAVVGAYLVRRFVGFPSSFDRLDRVAATTVLGGPLACLTSATIGVGSLLLTGSIERTDLLRSWGTWWLGDSIGVLVVIPLATAWGMELHRASRRRRFFVSLPVAAAVVITVLGYLDARSGDLGREQAEFQRRAEIMARTLEQTVLSKRDITQSIVSLYAIRDQIDRDEFQVFVQEAFERHPDLHGLSWNALVPRDRRDSVEEAVRQDRFAEFRITERNAEGEMVAAQDRDEYVVVFYLEPYEGNEEALGFDLASDPARARALAEARDTGQTVATPPIFLVQKGEGKPGFLFIAPIYRRGSLHDTPDRRRRNLHSFVSAVFVAEQMVEEAFASFQGEDIEYEIIDTSDPENARVLYSDRTSHQAAGVPARLVWSTDLEIGGRRWTARFRPGPGYTSGAQWGKVWAILAGGLFFTSLLGAFLLVVAGRASTMESSNEELRREILERERAEAALSASEEQFRAVFENAAVGVAVVDADEHPSISNAALQRMLGYSGEELAAMKFAEFTHPEDVDADLQQFRKLTAGTLPHYEMEKRYTTKSGETIWGYLTVSLVRDPEGEPLFAIGMVQDITERKKAEEERIKLETKVQQAQKLESLGVLAGGIAHDFNNVLVGVLSNASVALAELAPSVPARAHVKDIEVSAQRAADLANQLLAYSGRGKFVIEEVDLSDLVAETAQLVEVAVSKKVKVEYDLGENLPSVEADPTQLRQVVLNLITNGAEAIGDASGVVAVRTGQIEYKADSQPLSPDARELPQGDYVFVEITDTGGGMDEETRERIFDPFFTTKFTGRGLGLAAVLGIVRGHSGAIEVESEPGCGTRVSVLFPGCGKPVSKRQDRIATDSAWTGDGTVLLVDDEEVVRIVGSRMLKVLGFSVLTAADGVEALEIFRDRADDIVLVVLDLAMPRMGGQETFAEIRRIKKDAKVLLSSGYNEEATSSRFEESGVAGFVQKPYLLDVLRERLRAALEG